MDGSGIIGSLPSRERGLKYIEEVEDEVTGEVAPFAGAWIEIRAYDYAVACTGCRSLRGSVD